MLKKIVVGILILIGLLITLAIIAYISIDRQEIKTEISSYIEKEYNRELKFLGDANLKFIPLGLSFTNVEISEKINQQHKQQPDNFVEIGELVLAVNLKKLIFREIQLSKLVLNNSKINIKRDLNGKFNFDDLIDAGDVEIDETEISEEEITNESDKNPSLDKKQEKLSTKTESDEISKSKSDSTKSANEDEKEIVADSDEEKIDSNKVNLIIDEIDINNLNISFIDQTNKAEYQVNQMDLNLQDFQIGNTATITLTSKILANSPEIKNAQAEISFDGNINVDANSVINLTNINLSANANTNLNQIGNINIKNINTSGEIKIADNIIVNLPKFAINLSGDLAGNNIEADLKTGINLHSQQTRINASLNNLSLNSNIYGNFGNSFNKFIANTITFNSKTINAQELSINGEYQNKESENPINVNYDLQTQLSAALGQQFNLEKVQLSPITIIGNLTLPEIAKPLDIKISGDAITNLISQNVQVNLKGDVDQTNFNLKASMQSFSELKTKITLALDKFDFDQWFPENKSTTNPKPNNPENTKKTKAEVRKPAKKEATKNQAAKPALNSKTQPITKQNTDTDIAVDLSPLIGINADINVKAGEIKARGITVSKLKMQLNSNGEIVNLKPFNFEIAEGTFAGKAKLFPKLQRISLDSKIAEVNFGMLLEQLKTTDLVRGRADIDANLFTQGNSLNQFKSALGGNIKLLAKDGGIKGINIAQEVRKIEEKLGRKKSQAVDNELSTDFAELSADFIADKGILATNNLTMLSPYMRLSGKGLVDVAKEILDFSLRFKLVKSSVGQGATQLLGNKGIPIKVYGPMAEPKIQFDEAVYKSMIDAELLKKKKALADEAKAKIAEEKKRVEEKARTKAESAKKKTAEKAQQKIEDVKNEAQDTLKNKLKGLFKK